ncbi:Scd6-like Sm domain-containing protein [Lasiosphaeria hispida]|uniref:Scd6-like Sm domain-containing protein n=1 Tax=Lasiosphaeria hispida TaxID=260671 RepID=A0AAJ0H9L5_9PEZI|nr:Scd6-like Sm domain-containing protein [Lasiosphaeria hispida]
MSEFLGARISLVSRSNIRYVGTLHEINSDDSTVSLENVRTFGTEGRMDNPADEVAPSDQLYEYIVFRGTDVKDLRIEETAGTVKENKPPAVPNDPAIVGARPRPANVAPGLPPPGPSGPPGPPGPPGHHQGPPPGAPGFGYFPPPHMGGWGRAGPPGPNAFGGMQYPPPQWFPPGPPGQEFQPPMGHGPWNNYPYPGGHPVGAPTGPGQPGRQSANHTPSGLAQAPKPAPIGPTADKKPATPAQQSNIPSEPKSLSQAPKQPAAAGAPLPPVESKPTVEEVKATAASLASNAQSTQAQAAPKAIPTGPKVSRTTQILPAVPLPIALTSRPAQQSQASSKPAGEPQGNAAVTAAALRDATDAAKAAVALAMAKMDGSAVSQPSTGNAVDNLTLRTNDLRLNAPRAAPAIRGGRGRGPRPTKVEVPDSDFDFATANAKFNKQEVVKEAVIGSPLAETPNGEVFTPEVVAEAAASGPPAYNKSKSFFDNISSEAKDRLDNNGQKPGGREWRGEEQRKNIETFGQGSVDGGFRGYRGRGRGRGGRGRGYRGARGAGNGTFRPREPQPAPQ